MARPHISYQQQTNEGESNDAEGFECIQVSNNELNANTDALDNCKKVVLQPYLRLIKLVGWRQIQSTKHDLEQPRYIKILNIAYPIVFFLLLTGTDITQQLTCFKRAEVIATTDLISCNRKIITGTVVRDFLKLVIYLWGLYLFRYLEPEYLSKLIETAYINYSTGHNKDTHRKLITILRGFRIVGVLWIIFSFCTSFMRAFSIRLLGSSNATILVLNQSLPENTSRESYEGLHYFLVIISLIGFIFFDLLYILVIINYVSQCQLIIFFIQSIITSVSNKAKSLVEATKDVYRVFEFLKILNGQLASMVSLCLYIFLPAMYFSWFNGIKYIAAVVPSQQMRVLGFFVAAFNIIQWTLIALTPIIQAARLTVACKELKYLGLVVSSRPYTYTESKQETLDSFLLYTSSTNFTARLFGFSVYPKYIFIGLFAILIYASVNTFSVPWL